MKKCQEETVIRKGGIGEEKQKINNLLQVICATRVRITNVT